MNHVLTDTDIELIRTAHIFLKKSSDREKYNVAVALRDRDGKIYTAFNSFKGYWAGSICAELNCISLALSTTAPLEPQLDLCVAVKFDKERRGIEIVNTCGDCLQRMKDYYPEISFVVAQQDGSISVATLQELLPYGYNEYRGAVA
jgi:cytidine deaminase